jgi:hypothetical protein
MIEYVVVFWSYTVPNALVSHDRSFMDIEVANHPNLVALKCMIGRHHQLHQLIIWNGRNKPCELERVGVHTFHAQLAGRIPNRLFSNAVIVLKTALRFFGAVGMQ